MRCAVHTFRKKATYKLIKKVTQKNNEDGIKHIHEEIKDDVLDDAMNKLVPLTELGISLGNMTEKIVVPNDIPFFKIKKGEYPVQQFFYDYIFKSYYHKNETFERMHFLNFDWYRPENQIHVHPHEFVDLATNAGFKILEQKSTGTFVSLIAKR